MEGWIALYRNIKQHWVWQDAKILQRWLDLLTDASYEDCEVLFHGTRVKLNRGQLVTSKRQLLHQWQTNGKKVKDLLEEFIKEEMIMMEKIGNYTIITILNYDKFQKENSPKNKKKSPPKKPPEKTENAEDGSHKRQHFRSHPHIINSNNINNNISLSHNNGDRNFFETFKNDSQAKEFVRNNLGMDEEELIKWLSEFDRQIKYEGKKHNDYNDYKAHFPSWVKKQPQYIKQKNNAAKQQEDRYDPRRGTDVDGKKASDYGRTF